ncbi:MAG: Calx-beta domain-containing protein, partial [Isosphaeraceae bacterium]
TSDGSQVLGNEAQGVAVYSPGAQVGPGNVISANLIGVLVSGPEATGVTVIGNLIGTDITGELDLGNEEQGVLIDSATGVVVSGNAAGSQVISGNNVGVEIEGLSATANSVQGNLIGTDKSGTLALPNSQQGILIEGAPGNTMGGTTAAARNVISANRWGIQLDGPAATGNLVEGNFIGTDVTGMLPLGNEIDGVIFSTGASNNTIGGTGSGQGNTIAFNIDYGVDVDSGTGDSILTNSIFSNGQLGIFLNPLTNANDSIEPPLLTATIPSANLQTTTVQGSYSSLPNQTFLIQFFSNPANPSASYVYEGKTFIGSTVVTTGSNGSVNFSATLETVVTSSSFITATATSLSQSLPGLHSGDTSEFSNPPPVGPVSLSFSMANYTVDATAGFVELEVLRTGNLSAAVSVNYATSNGTAIAGRDYVAAMGTLWFPPNVTEEPIYIRILDNPLVWTPTSFFNVTLSQPTGGATLDSISSATVTISRIPMSAPTVTGVQLITNHEQIVTGIVVSFSELLNSTTAVNLLNYNYSVTTAGRDHVFGTRDDLLIPITKAVYSPSNMTVTLTLGRGIHPPTPFRLAINQLTDVPGAGVGVSNLCGELLSTYVVVLKGTAGGIVPSTRQPAVPRQAPRSVAAVDAVLATGKAGGTWVAHVARDRRARPNDRRR